MKKYTYPLLAVVIFIAAQFLASFLLVIPLIAKIVMESNGQFSPESLTSNLTSTGYLLGALILADVIAIAAISAMKMIGWKKVMRFQDVNWGKAACYIAAAACGIVAADFASAVLDLPNLMEEQMLQMSSTTLGILSIGVLGPICEELIFREAVLGSLLRRDVKPVTAIIFSAIVFGIVHLNPQQVPFAAIIGALLGYIYYKTGNIVVPCIIHIANNSFAVWQMNTLGENVKDFSMVESVGGMPVAIACIVVGTALCLWIFKKAN